MTDSSGTPSDSGRQYTMSQKLVDSLKVPFVGAENAPASEPALVASLYATIGALLARAL